MASFFGDDVFDQGVTEEKKVEQDAPLSPEESLRALAKESGLIDGDEPTTEPTEESSDTEAEGGEEVSSTFGFKSEEDFQSAALKAVEAKLGVSIEAVVAMLEDFGSFRNQQLIDQQQAPLKNEWGASFSERYDLVVERFKTLPADMQKALDNVEGARLIWAQLEKEGAQVTPSAGVPRFDRTGVVNNRQKAKFLYTLSELDNIPFKEYQAQQEKINDAFARGLVDLDN
jgi:hypothetical protein